jgi:molybdenum cofactor biosynthesis enzyme MoaA
MDTARAIRLVHEVGDAGIRNLRFTGGEPFLRRDFFEILKQSNTSPFKRIVVQTPNTKIPLSLDLIK